MRLRDKFTVGIGTYSFAGARGVRDSSQLEEGEVSSQLKSRYCSIELFHKNLCVKNIYIT